MEPSSSSSSSHVMNTEQPKPEGRSVELPGHTLGHNCLWVLCDMRMAVVILDVFMILTFLASLVPPLLFLLQEDDDDATNPFGSHIFLTLVALLTHGWSIYGALQYKVWPLVVNMVYLTLGHVCSMVLGFRANHVFDYPIISPWQLYVIPLFGIALGLYPHAVLAYQIHSGIMSKDRYHRFERHCCCCCYSSGAAEASSPV